MFVIICNKLDKANMYEGTVVTNASHFPYALLLISHVGNMTYKECTAVAIEINLAVTAAHCFLESDKNAVSFSTDKVLLSSFLREGDFRDHEVTGVYFHPLHMLLENDIALIKTNGTLSLTLPLLPRMPFLGTDTCTIIGFGPTKKEEKTGLRAPSVLGVAPLPQNYCKSLQNYKTSLICVPLGDGLGPCHGDSGGPLICSGTVVGVLSRGLVWGEVGCGKPLYSILFFEDLFYHRTWIEGYADRRKPSSLSHKIFDEQTFILYILIVVYCIIKIVIT
ncbi:trypsin-1-like [Cimex lectularius]|uniref:Peptidase S1 domain-containing protein n=1 Tax=Cimex lectularius TaxID=79782 RepID=A0A8I6RC49_CIMLE|nr:trypsin-1-like [Cimex lectularius]